MVPRAMCAAFEVLCTRNSELPIERELRFSPHRAPGGRGFGRSTVAIVSGGPNRQMNLPDGLVSTLPAALLGGFVDRIEYHYSGL
jgi:hypothetical protein